jgi:hypothetical protein
MVEPVRYSGTITWRDQPSIAAAVDCAAKARGTKPSEWLRQAVRTALQLDGINPAAIPARDAGALYDQLIESRKVVTRYAWVESGEIRDMSYSDTKPNQQGRTWLPVEHVDSEPFDPVIHWRLAPVFTIHDVYGVPDRVVCTYPVVSKSLEYA